MPTQTKRTFSEFRDRRELAQLMNMKPLDEKELFLGECESRYGCDKKAMFNIDGRKLCRLHTGYYLLNNPVPEDVEVKKSIKRTLLALWALVFGFSFLVLAMLMQ